MAQRLSDVVSKRRKQEGAKRLVRGPDGQLQEVTGEEIQTLSGKQGLQTPTSPMAGAQMGASPDAAKMLGDARQKRAALSLAMDPEQQLATSERRAQSRTQAGASEQEKMQKSAALEALGGLGDRVDNVITSMFTGTEDAAVDLAETELAEDLSEEHKALLDKVAANPGDTAAIADFMNATGKSPQGYLSGDTAAAVAQAVPDAVQVTPEMFTDMGFEGPEEVANLLGIPPEQLDGVSIAQFTDVINAQLEAEFSQVEDLQRMATDPNLSPAERAEARNLLRDMGSVGVRASEEEIDELEETIEKADTVEFDGKEFTVEEFLSDDTMSQLVKEYLDAPDDVKKKMQEDNPEFTGYIDAHENTLRDATDDITTGASKLTEVKTANEGIAAIPNTSAPLDGGMMKALFPDSWGKYTDVDLTEKIKEVPFLNRLHTGGDDALNKDRAITRINELSTDHPDIAAEISRWSEAEIEASGIFSPSDTTKFDKYVKLKKDQKWLGSIQSSDEDSARSNIGLKLFGNADMSIDEMRSKLTNAKSLSALGVGDDEATELAQKLLSANSAKGIAELMDTHLSGFSKDNLRSGGESPTLPDFTTLGVSDEPIPEQLAQFHEDFSDILGDGALDKEELLQLPDDRKAKMSPESLEYLLTKNKNMDEGARGALKKILTDKRMAGWGKELNNITKLSRSMDGGPHDVEKVATANSLLASIKKKWEVLEANKDLVDKDTYWHVWDSMKRAKKKIRSAASKRRETERLEGEFLTR